VEDEYSGGDEHLDPGDDAAEHGKATVDRLAGCDYCLCPCGGEGLLGSLPLVLAVGASAE